MTAARIDAIGAKMSATDVKTGAMRCGTADDEIASKTRVTDARIAGTDSKIGAIVVRTAATGGVDIAEEGSYRQAE